MCPSATILYIPHCITSVISPTAVIVETKFDEMLITECQCCDFYPSVKVEVLSVEVIILRLCRPMLPDVSNKNRTYLVPSGYIAVDATVLSSVSCTMLAKGMGSTVNWEGNGLRVLLRGVLLLPLVHK